MTTQINFTWNIVEVGTMLKTMMIRYQRDKENEPPSFLHIAIPKKGETENLDDYISQSNLVLNVSREDSNSLVLRTAINIGTPVVNLEEELTSNGLVSYSEFNISNFAKLLINKLLYGANEGK